MFVCASLFSKLRTMPHRALSTNYRKMRFSSGVDPFVYSRAVVCGGVASTLPASSLRLASSKQKVDLESARHQQKQYVEVLQGLVKEVHVIPVDERYPDCVFVEDPVVVCGDTAFLPILGHHNRKGESAVMKKMMEDLGLKIVEMVEPGLMDGGDVLFTGREFFVGQSKRTNESGMSQLAAAFPDYPITGIPVEYNLHLKSYLSMAGPDLIAITTSHDGQVAKKFIQEKGHFKYRFYDIPDDPGANCLYLNNTIIHASSDWLPSTCEKFQQLESPARKITLSGSELNKVDGCFSCSSVLIK